MYRETPKKFYMWNSKQDMQKKREVFEAENSRLN